MTLDRYLDEGDAEEVPDPDDPPDLRRRRPIKHPFRSHSIGQIVYAYNRDGGVNGYFTPRNRHAGEENPTNPSGKKNFFEKYQSYPITVSVIGKLQSYEVERIFVLERETKDLYEFTMEQYLDAPDYADYEAYGSEDLQKCPSVEDAVAVWKSVSASDLWV